MLMQATITLTELNDSSMKISSHLKIPILSTDCAPSKKCFGYHLGGGHGVGRVPAGISVKTSVPLRISHLFPTNGDVS